MAHFEAKKAVGGRKCMVLDHSPIAKIYDDALRGIDHSPTSNDLAQFPPASGLR